MHSNKSAVLNVCSVANSEHELSCILHDFLVEKCLYQKAKPNQWQLRAVPCMGNKCNECVLNRVKAIGYRICMAIFLCTGRAKMG